MPYTEYSLPVLLIEDNITDEALFLTLAKKADFPFAKIKVADTEEKALKLLADFSPAIIFLNYTFKKNKSNSIIKKIKLHSPYIPIVLLVNKNILLPSKDKLLKMANDYLYTSALTAALLDKCIFYTLDKCKNELQVKETSERYDLLTKATNNIVWDWDLNKHASYWVGSGLPDILGYPQHEMIVDSDFWESNLHPGDRERVISRLQDIFKKASSNKWEDEYRFKNKNGTYSYINDRGFIIYKEGKPVRMIGSMEDVTEKKLAEASRLLSENNYKNLFDNNPLATYIWSVETHKILEANEMALKEYGYSKPEFLKLTVFDLRPEEEIEKFKKRVREVLSEKKLNHEYIWIHRNKNGEEILMQVSSYKIMYAGVPAVLSLAKNVTEEAALTKKLETQKNIKTKQIAEAVIIAQEKERTEIGKELHDNVNQLLSASRLYIEAAKTAKTNSNGLLTQASEYIMTAIEEIRVLSKALNTPLINEIGFSEAVENLADDLMVVNDIKITINKNNFDEISLHENFKLTLFRIMQEQVTNILKHSKATKASIKLERSSTKVCLQIQDNGIGFDTKKKSKGIGLINIKSRAALYKGVVNISSKKEKGSRLLINFPLAEALEDNEMINS